MSKSYKLPWVKDKPRRHNRTSAYWRLVRRVINNEVRLSEEFLSLPKEIINDYDYCNYRWIAQDKVKYSRK